MNFTNGIGKHKKLTYMCTEDLKAEDLKAEDLKGEFGSRDISCFPMKPGHYQDRNDELKEQDKEEKGI
jgi:hypothetical protein